MDATAKAACCAAYEGFVDLDMVLMIATNAITLRSHHTGAELVEKLKGGFIPIDAELALKLDSRDSLGVRRSQIGSPEPYREWCVRFLHDGACHQPSLFPAVAADQNVRSGFDPIWLYGFAAALAHKPLRPADRLKIGGAGEVIGK